MVDHSSDYGIKSPAMAPRPETKLAAVEDTADVLALQLDHADDRYLECRDIRHKWKVTRNYELIDASDNRSKWKQGHDQYVERRLTCQRCRTVRVESYLITSYGKHKGLARLDVRYEYPDGYLFHGNGASHGETAELIRGFRWSQAQDRKASAARLTEKASG